MYTLVAMQNSYDLQPLLVINKVTLVVVINLIINQSSKLIAEYHARMVRYLHYSGAREASTYGAYSTDTIQMRDTSEKALTSYSKAL